MAKNIAIILGISEYSNAKKLEGCKVDVDCIRTLLDATGKYDEILQMDGKVDAVEINKKLPEFIKKYKSEVIDEVFFYYSGHGSVIGDVFAYIASDYNPSKPNMTSLNNNDVDGLLKSLNANLVVKIIDACHSGTQYIKDIDLIPKYINMNKGEFANCYFMFSSRNDQTSIGTRLLSVFTRSFIQAIKSCPVGDIKYDSIAKNIADDFITNPTQKPQFVTQADLTEVFCTKDARLDGILDNLLIGRGTGTGSKPAGSDSPLLRAIKVDVQSYRSEEDICKILENAKDNIASIIHRADILELFDCEISYPKGHFGFTKDSEVGEWLSKGKHNYYAKVERTSYDQLRKWIFNTNSIGQVGQKDSLPFCGLDPLLNLSRSYISGFSSLIDYPFDQVSCLFKPKLINLFAYKVQMAFVCSKTELTLFSYTVEIKNVKDLRDFTEVAPLSFSKMRFVDGDISKVFIEQILSGEDAILAKLKNQFLNVPDSSIG